MSAECSNLKCPINMLGHCNGVLTLETEAKYFGEPKLFGLIQKTSIPEARIAQAKATLSTCNSYTTNCGDNIFVLKNSIANFKKVTGIK